MDIFVAIEQGRVDLVDRYVQQGGDLNATSELGDALLEAAVANNQLEIVRSFLAAGADPNHYGKWESTSALALALENGYIDICRMLVAAGANVNIRLEGGITPLMGVANSPDEDCELLRLLLQYGADPKARSDGETALSFAVYRGHRNICRELAPLVLASDRQLLIKWLQLRGEQRLLSHQREEIRETLLRTD